MLGESWNISRCVFFPTLPVESAVLGCMSVVFNTKPGVAQGFGKLTNRCFMLIISQKKGDVRVDSQGAILIPIHIHIHIPKVYLLELHQTIASFTLWTEGCVHLPRMILGPLLCLSVPWWATESGPAVSCEASMLNAVLTLQMMGDRKCQAYIFSSVSTGVRPNRWPLWFCLPLRCHDSSKWFSDA